MAWKHRIYRYTSIARPVDPAFPTNKAVLMLVPVGAALNAGLHVLGAGTHAGAGGAALSGLLVVFGAWALARELAPDDDSAAFVSMAAAFIVQLFFAIDSFIPLFAALFLARVVNRTTGKPATLVDSLLVTALTVWATFALQQPLLGLVGATAFALDAVLRNGQRRQLVFSLACGAASLVAAARAGIGLPPPAAVPQYIWIVDAATLALFVAAIWLTRRVTSVCDVCGAPLDRSRVRGGMLVGLLVAAQTTVSGQGGDAAQDPLTWACLAGVGVVAIVNAVRG